MFGALSRILPRHRLTVSYRAVDEDLIRQLSSGFYDSQLERLPDGRALSGLERSLTVDYLPDGKGLPGAGDGGVESVVAEVNRVVDLVFEHARVRPRESLAVITASDRHATRVAQAIRLQMANHPLLADFFASGPESFRVVTVDRAAGLVRDRVIFSLGYGRTPHGRALHGFGPLSEPDGRSKFALAMTRARTHIHILTCFRPEDLDESRLSYGAVDFFELLDRELSGNSLLGTPATRALDSERETGEDPLVADLADRLSARGARVWHHYDGALDLAAAADPISLLGREEHEIPEPVAVESDGTAQYQAMSVRERSRLRPQMLERLGWRYVPLWTIEVFTDPSSCADQISRCLGVNPAAGDDEFDSLMGKPLDESMTAVIGSPRARRRNPVPAAAQAPAAAPDLAVDGAGREDAGDAAGSEAVEVQAREESEAPVSDQDQSRDAAPAEEPDAAEQPAAPESPEAAVAPSPDSELLPKVAPNDAGHTWGDSPSDHGHDEWLRENKPPHWG